MTNSYRAIDRPALIATEVWTEVGASFRMRKRRAAAVEHELTCQLAARWHHLSERPLCAERHEQVELSARSELSAQVEMTSHERRAVLQRVAL